VAKLLAGTGAWSQTVVPPAIPETPPAYRDLRLPPLKHIPVPKVTAFSLPNGLRVFLLEDHELPVVSGTVRVRTGNLFDPADKVGLADLTGTVIRSGGTHSKTGDQLDEELENIAASVESSIGETSGSVSFFAMRENTDEVMDLFKNVLTGPEFRQEKIDLAKEEMRSEIARRNDDAHGVAQREFANIVYGKDTPYGWEVEYATLERIQRSDLVAFYQRYFFPANALLAVWGDFSIPEMQARLTKLLASWDVQRPKVPPFPAVRGKARPGIYVADKQDVTQTFFVEGHVGGELRDADFPALEIMADILGGGFQSRLVERVRTQLGLAYDISADWGADYDHPGLFEIGGSTKSPSTAETLAAINQQIERIRTEAVTGDELETARQTALNSLVFVFDTTTKTLARVLNYEYYGYPQDFIERYEKGLETCTRADVLRVAGARVHAKDLTIVAVGRADDFRKSLATLGLPISSIDLTIPAAQPAARVTAPAPPASQEKREALLARVQKAVGGADKLAAVKDMVEVAEYRVDAAMGGATMKRTDQWVAPSYFREDTQLPGGTIVVYADEKSGWMSGPQGSGPLPAAQWKAVREKLLRLYFPMLLSDRLRGRQVTWGGEDILDISDGSGNGVRLFVDPKTSLPAKVTYASPQMGAPEATVEESYERFEEVSGVKVPQHITITQNGRKFADVTVKSLQVNTGLKPDALNKKP
jgi:zinc protease